MGACYSVDSSLSDSINNQHKESEDEYEYDYEENVNVPQKSKIAISSAYLISDIILDFFKSPENKCKYMSNTDIEDMITGILSNIFIIGGACRDLLLIKPINDLDCICNTRELNKIHLKHLNKYHSKKEDQNLNDSSCILWKHYLNKFNEETKIYDLNVMKNKKDKTEKNKKEIMNTYEYIRNCDYILNAKFISSIITDCNQLDGKRNAILREIGIIRLMTIKINKQFIYNNYDLNNQEFDFLDVCKHDFIGKYREMMEKEKDKKYHQIKTTKEVKKPQFFESKIFSMKVIPAIDTNESKTDDLIPIDLPIYNTKIDVHVGSADFSIDCVYISLYSIRNIIENNANININNDEGKTFNVTNNIYNEIRKKVKGIPVYNIMKDLKYKLLTTTLETVLHDTPQIHFWRIIKFAIRLYDDGWRINPDLIEYHQQLYYQWIDDDDNYLNDDKNVAYFIKKMFNYGFATNGQQYEIMVEKVFNILDFNKKLINALNRNDIFKSKWINTLNEKENNIILVFKRNKYPVNIPNNI